MFNCGKHVTINPRSDDEPIQNCFDKGVFIVAEFEVASEIPLDAIHPHATVTLQSHLLEGVLPALAENLGNRRAQFHLRVWGQLKHALKHLPRRTGRHRLHATRTMRRTERRVEHAQVIPEIGHRADGGTRIAANRFLVDRNDRRKSVDEIDIGLAQLIHKALGVSGHRCE